MRCSPILEPKPNVRLHRNTPDDLLDKVVDMIADSQGAPFLLNFDERSMAGMMLQAKKAGVEHFINKDNVHEYAPVGCLENTMVGNDRSGTVDANLNLLKAVEFALTGGYHMLPFTDPMTGKTEKSQAGARIPVTQALSKPGMNSGRLISPKPNTSFNALSIYTSTETLRATFSPTPYLSCLVRGCAEKGLDVTRGWARVGLCHHRSCHLCHNGRFAPSSEIPGLRQENLHHGRTGPCIKRQLGRV